MKTIREELTELAANLRKEAEGYRDIGDSGWDCDGAANQIEAILAKGGFAEATARLYQSKCEQVINDLKELHERWGEAVRHIDLHNGPLDPNPAATARVEAITASASGVRKIIEKHDWKKPIIERPTYLVFWTYSANYGKKPRRVEAGGVVEAILKTFGLTFIGSPTVRYLVFEVGGDLAFDGKLSAAVEMFGVEGLEGYLVTELKSQGLIDD